MGIRAIEEMKNRRSELIKSRGSEERMMREVRKGKYGEFKGGVEIIGKKSDGKSK